MSTTLEVKKPRAPRAKKAQASAKMPTHQSHGAIAPSPVNMEKMFGIKSVYTTQDIKSYKVQLAAYAVVDLHAHAHDVGVLPMDPKEKLILALERKFLEVQSRSLPVKFIPTTVTPEGQDYIKRFMAGTLA